MMPWRRRGLIIAAVALAALALGIHAWNRARPAGPGEAFVSGNGRIEATEIDIAAKLPGRIQEILVTEGDFVKAGQVVATMQMDVLEAQRREAVAQHRQAVNAAASAAALVTVRESELLAAQALQMQRESEREVASRRLERSGSLSEQGILPVQEFEDDQARARSAEAAVHAAAAQIAAARAAIQASRAQLVGAHSSVEAAAATVARIDADIADSQLKAPRDGRVQYRVAQPGEVLAAGGKVLNLVDISDVYMTFFVPEKAAGRVALGAEVRIVLDAAPTYVIPARVSFVASTAQFTPRTVETASEREKLMFRVRARIDPELLQRYAEQVKTGIPGVGWVKLDADAAWPESLAIGLH